MSGAHGDGSGEPPIGGGGGGYGASESGYGGGGGGGGYGGSYEGGGYGGNSGGGYGGRGGGGGGYGGRGAGGGGGYGGRGGGGGGYGGNRGGYQGDRGGRGGGGGGGGRGGGRSGGSGRDGDWRCPNQSCGNVNFARRTECNKCGAPSPASNDNQGGYNRGGRGGGGYENNRGGRGNYNDSGSGQSGNRYDSGSGRGGRDDGGYGQGAAGNYGNPPRSYGGTANNAPEAVAPQSYVGGPNSYPPSYGAPGGYDRNTYDGNGSGGRGGSSRFGGAPRDSGGYDGGASEGNSDKVKQCDETCGDSCDNARIYISDLPPDVTVDELRELFGSIGQVARIKQKRGYKDQWPWSIKLYTDEQGNSKGDAVLSYEDPSAAHSAGGFFNNHEIRGHKISVSMAEKSAPKAPSYGSGGRGNYGGDRRRDNYRDAGSSGPDRHYHGGNRSRPY